MINVNIKGIDLKFKTSNKVFSPRAVDAGTLAMLTQVDFEQGDKVLDLGCGYGVVGILAAKLIGSENVVMLDIDKESVNIAKENSIINGVPEINIAQSDGLKDLDETNFTKILSNPPYHADFSVPKHFIEKSFNRLKIDGRIYMVTKRKEWYKKKLVSVFGGVKISEIEDYYVFMSIKKGYSYAKKKTRR